jgi:hypothetical protein
MYLPENNAQMFDILSELRVYAATNGLHGLAEKIDDSLLLLAVETRGSTRRPRKPRILTETQ